jgi:outer membrane lipoprotein-sorting protein
MKKFLLMVGIAAALVLFLVLPLGLPSAPAAAAKEQRGNTVMLSPDLKKAEDYLRDLRTAKARFKQTGPDGNVAMGNFYLHRPGRLRFEYDAPVKDFVVADGIFVYFYDSELGEQSNAPIGQTLADFLLRGDLRLSGDIKVADMSKDRNYLNVTVIQADEPGAGSLTLTFAQEPFFLRKWSVMDATGAFTTVELEELQTGMKLDSALFVYQDPARFESPRFNQ